MRALGPAIASRLKVGGYWSLVGGTKASYPALQAKGNSKLIRWVSGAGARQLDDTVLNPANLQEAVNTMEAHGFELWRAEETFRIPIAGIQPFLSNSWNSAIAVDGSRR